VDELKNKSDIKKQDYSDFARKIKDLKNWRIKGDYDNVAITIDQSRKAVGLADELRKQLKNTFKVWGHNNTSMTNYRNCLGS